jgi:hypothetical protein
MTVGLVLSALLLTMAVESAAAFFMGFRGKNFYILLASINAITNPSINLILNIIYMSKLSKFYYWALFLLEAAVVIAEWQLLWAALKKNRKYLFITSLVINLSSYLTGVIVFNFLL